MLVGTYHAIASLLLRRDATAFGLSGANFTTLDEDDANSLMKSAFRECDIKPGDSVTPAKVRARALLLAQQTHRARDPFPARVPRERRPRPHPRQVVSQAQAGPPTASTTTTSSSSGASVSARTRPTPRASAPLIATSSATSSRTTTSSITKSCPASIRSTSPSSAT